MMLYPAMNKLTSYIPNRYMMVKLLQSELEAGLAAQQQQQAAFAVEDDKDEPLQPSER